MSVRAGPLVRLSDRVVLYEGPDSMRTVTLTMDGTYHSQTGVVRHASIIGKPYGARVPCTNGRGFVAALPWTPELWSRTLSLRTQILYEADIGTILMALDVRPGLVVIEAGTGSGALSSALAAALRPGGRLYTFEFHEQRAAKAREDFAANGLQDVIVAQHRDVVRDGLPQDLSADRVFFDLPNVADAIAEGDRVLRRGGVICAFCPCIEQSQKVTAQLYERKFTSVRTFECIQRRVHCSLASEGEPIEFSMGAGAAIELPPAAQAGSSTCQYATDVRGHTGYLTFAMK